MFIFALRPGSAAVAKPRSATELALGPGGAAGALLHALTQGSRLEWLFWLVASPSGTRGPLVVPAGKFHMGS